MVSDGIGEWYKLRRLKEIEEEQRRREREATQTGHPVSDENVPPHSVHHREPPVLEQLWDVLPADTQDKIEWRFTTALIGSILFWVGFWLGRLQ